MNVSETYAHNVPIVLPHGRIDTTSAGMLERALTTHIEACRYQIIIDFSAVTLISSAGLRVLLTITKKLNALDGQLVLCCFNQHVQEVFDVSGLLTLFVVCADRSHAIAALKQ